MKLSEIGSEKLSLKKINEVTSNRFGFKIDYNAITLPKAEAIRSKIMETVNSIRRSSAIHTAEQNPQYLEMLVVYEGLSRWIDAYNVQEQRRKIYEGELGQAEAILAAKDMVDSIQDMIEKVGKMQNEQLPALIDSVRDQIGAAQADTFKNSVGQALATLSTQLNQSREQLDGSARGLTGEAPPEAMSMGDAAGTEGLPGAGLGGSDFDMDELGSDAPPDEFGGVDASAGGAEELGRERR